MIIIMSIVYLGGINISMAHKGKYKPRNPSKYKGDPTKVIYRSSWERKLMVKCDLDIRIVEWNSEEIVVPYISPLDGKIHRYFVDFYIRNVDGKIFLVEVKPYAQTIPPKIPKKRTRRFYTEVATYEVNQAKWNAAEEFAELKGWSFIKMTEKELLV